MPTKRVEKGITRFDIHERGTYGYMVRVSRQDQKYNQFFSDKEFGGKRKALTAARDCYQQWVSELPPPATSKGVKSRRNKTGVVGVHLAVTPSTTWADVAYSSYVASWKEPDGYRGKLSFSVEKYGKRKAFALACLAREHEMDDRDKVEKLYAKTSKRKTTKKKTTKKKGR